MRSLANLAGALDDVFVRREFFEAAGAAGMELAGADADLRPHAELVPVGESARSVDVDRSRIHLAREPLGCFVVRGDDHVAVMRAVALDVVDRRLKITHDSHRENEIEIFFGPILVRRGLCLPDEAACALIAAQFDAM